MRPLPKTVSTGWSGPSRQRPAASSGAPRPTHRLRRTSHLMADLRKGPRRQLHAHRHHLRLTCPIPAIYHSDINLTYRLSAIMTGGQQTWAGRRRQEAVMGVPESAASPRWRSAVAGVSLMVVAASLAVGGCGSSGSGPKALACPAKPAAGGGTGAAGGASGSGGAGGASGSGGASGAGSG